MNHRVRVLSDLQNDAQPLRNVQAVFGPAFEVSRGFLSSHNEALWSVERSAYATIESGIWKIDILVIDVMSFNSPVMFHSEKLIHLI